MALAVIQEQNLTDIADAIRSKNGTSDTYLPSQMAQAITDIPTGGGQDSGGKYLVQVIDYDGTVLKSDHLNSGATFTMPDQPSHSRLVFQEWSTPVTITNGEVTVGNSDITIGAVYTTASGLNEFDIELTKVTGLTVTLASISGRTIDWGDGSTDTSNSHTYVDYGKYTIKSNKLIKINSGNNYWLVRAFIVSALANEQFRDCMSLKSITIDKNLSVAYSSIFRSCYPLAFVAIPNTATGISPYSFQNCYSLTAISLPPAITAIPTGAFNGCSALRTITIPSGVVSMASSAFYGCKILSRVYSPAGLIGIDDMAFSNTNCVIMYDFSLATSVPALGASVFPNINGICKIIVPDALYDTWIGSTNWVAYANYIYKASEV